MSNKNNEKAAKKNGGGPKEQLKGKRYDEEMEKLHVELVKLQEWVKFKGVTARARVVRSKRSPSA